MQNQVQSMINYFRNICLNQKQPNRTRNALSLPIQRDGSQNSKILLACFASEFFSKFLTLLHLTLLHLTMFVLTLRWHVLRVCTYKSNKMYEWGYGTRFQACSHKERIGTEIPKLLKYFNNFESNCYIKYLFNFRTGATFNFFSHFFRGIVQ